MIVGVYIASSRRFREDYYFHSLTTHLYTIIKEANCFARTDQTDRTNETDWRRWLRFRVQRRQGTAYSSLRFTERRRCRRRRTREAHTRFSTDSPRPSARCVLSK